MPGRADCCGAGTTFEATSWLSLDPCGLFCVSCSFGVHFYATTVIVLYLIPDSVVAKSLFGVFYLPCTILAIWSLIKAWRTNPGAVPMGARPLTTIKRAQSINSASKMAEDEQQRSIRRCHKCNDNYKPPRAHHDSVTGRCIVKFDHYCPWVGNAVGALNHKFFCLFIGYSASTCIMTILFIVLRLVTCASFTSTDQNDEASSVDHQPARWHEPTNKKIDPTRLLLQETEATSSFNCISLFGNYFVVILMIVAVSFLVFTCCMFWEQLEAIESNTSKIARMKLRVGEGGTELERVSHDFNEMFGGDSPSVAWHWFIPLDVQFPKCMAKVVLGYEWDPTFGDEPFQEDDLVAVMESKDLKKESRDVEKGEAFSDESDTPSMSDGSSGPRRTAAAKKRSASTKNLIDNVDFVDRTLDRLT